MKAILKEIYSLEIDIELSKYIPEEMDFFEIVIRLMIGPKNEDGADSFDITVCSAKWISEKCQYGNQVWGKSLLIVDKYDYIEILNSIESKINTLSEESWSKLAIELSRFFEWEFESYRIL